MDKYQDLIGALVQLCPTDCRNPMFGGCIMVITEVREWGLIGYVQALGQDGEPGGQAYYRARWDEFQPCHTGKAVWMIGSSSEAPQ